MPISREKRRAQRERFIRNAAKAFQLVEAHKLERNAIPKLLKRLLKTLRTQKLVRRKKGKYYFTPKAHYRYGVIEGYAHPWEKLSPTTQKRVAGQIIEGTLLHLHEGFPDLPVRNSSSSKYRVPKYNPRNVMAVAHLLQGYLSNENRFLVLAKNRLKELRSGTGQYEQRKTQITRMENKISIYEGVREGLKRGIYSW